MYKDHSENVGVRRRTRRQKPLPRELAIAAAALATIMMVMGLALWVVAGQTNDHQGQSNADTSRHMPTGELLQSLADDLGPTATPADLEAAVEQWLGQQYDSQPVLLASATHSG